MQYRIVSRGDSESKKIEQQIHHYLKNFQWDKKQEGTLIICIGGDGTILRAVHEHMDHMEDVYFVGIHTGTLGFLTDYTKEEISIFLYDITHREPQLYESRLLEFKVDKKEKKHYALNEIAIQNVHTTQATDVYINDEFFERSQGSGMVLSTQAGSTAMIRGLNAGVIDDGLSVLQLAEIMPIFNQVHRSLRTPYIMRSDRVVSFQSPSFKRAILTYDHKQLSLEDVNCITCRLSKRKVRFARYRSYSYFERLRMLY